MKSRIICSAIFVAVLAGAAMAEPRQPVGERFEVSPDDLPKPYATLRDSNPPEVIARPAGATLNVPPGFRANIFRAGLANPRWLAVAGNGDVILTEMRAGRVRVLRDADGDGKAEFMATFTDEIEWPHGLAIHRGHLYVSNPRRIWRYPYKPGQTKQTGPAEIVTRPGALGDGSGHWTRNLAVSPDGESLFVAVGSRNNLGEEPLPRASVQRMALDGSGQSTYASGLRNAVGIAFYPGSNDLYVAVNERDGLGDGLPPDYLTRVRQGEFFGWPYAYAGPNPDPTYGARRPDQVALSKLPDLLFEAHTAPLGLVFYDSEQFPKAYRGDAFVALHGSSNAGRPRGYMVVRVPFKGGRPAGGYESFATGFWHGGDGPAKVWGRPAGLAVAKDGSLLIADDAGEVIWRVAYVGE